MALYLVLRGNWLGSNSDPTDHSTPFSLNGCMMHRTKNRDSAAVKLLFLCGLAVVLSSMLIRSAAAEDEFTAQVKRYPYSLREPVVSVVGSPTLHTLRPKETLLDIARHHGLGYNEVELFYPKLDPWLPPVSRTILMPTQWVLPPTRHEELVINIAELRLYFFQKSQGMVQTYPIGIGDEGWESPLGSFVINDKRPSPSWYIPASLQAKYGMAVMPPGPENPLGEFVMKFSAGAYGIHGTAMPWGVGRLVSHGCIRCYPEHIRILYPQVKMGTHLEIIYEPIKLGRINNQIYVEVHPDVYQKIADFRQYAEQRLQASGWADQVDMTRFLMAVQLQNGAPINITKVAPLAAVSVAEHK
jgi:L,D-transpeptidase ErfK/SrfK